MEIVTENESQSTSAAKVAGFAAAIALTGALAIKSVKFVSRRVKARHLKTAAPEAA